MAARPAYMRYRREDVRVAGTSFTNDESDGGEERQELLAALCGEPTMAKLEPTKFLREETGELEPAIKVRSAKSRKVIGWIPKDRVSEFEKDTEMVLQVTRGKGTYGAILTRPEEPSPKQYGAVKALVRSGKIKKMPIYDKTAYQWALTECASPR